MVVIRFSFNKGPITFIIIFLLVMSFKIIEHFVLSSIKPIYGLILFTIFVLPGLSLFLQEIMLIT